MNRIVFNAFRTFKLYHNNSIFYKYLKRIILILIIPLTILCIIFYMQYSSTILNSFKIANNQKYAQSYTYINNVFEEIKRIYSSTKVENDLFTYETSTYDEITNLERFNCISHLQSMFNSSLSSHSYLHSINLYSSKSDYVLSTDSSNTITNFFNLAWYEDYKKNGSPVGIINSTINVPNKPSKNIISFYWK